MSRTLFSAVVIAAVTLTTTVPAIAQHAVFRVRGRCVTETGAPVPDADVRVEAFFGYAGNDFAGQRTFSARTDPKGTWSINGLLPGVWRFEVLAPGFLPETVVLPPRLLTTVSQGTSGMSLTWELILKPERMPDGERGLVLKAAADAAANGKTDAVRSALLTVPVDADAAYLAAAGRIAIVANDPSAASSLFKQALERDPNNYRAELGLASVALLRRDFDSASRAFDAARTRTHDKDEQRFITAAIGELASAVVR